LISHRVYRHASTKYLSDIKHSLVHLRPRAVVHGKLQSDDDVVLHASDLAAESDALPAEAVDCLFVLEGVHLHLLLDAAAGSDGVVAEQRVTEGDALVSQHVVEERHHAVLDFLRCQDPVAVGIVVDAEARVRQAVQGALVVLCLEAEVTLHHDDDFAELQRLFVLESPNMALEKRELFLGLCSMLRSVSA